MALIKVSELTSTGSVKIDDILMISSTNGSGYTSNRISIEDLVSSQPFLDLGSSGTAGSSGTSGSNGSSGTSGSNGSSGSDGSSGTSGSSGSSGTSGSNGTNGSSGSSGSSGSNGTDGTSGSNGTNGSSGSSGSNGTNGSSGSNGTDGSSGSSGSSGSNGTNGSSGSSGSNGTDGSSGTSGTSGTSGLVTLTGSTAGGLITYNGSGTNATVQSGLTYSGTTLTAPTGSFDNVIVNGQPTTYGVVNGSYLLAQNNAEQTGVGNGTAISFQTTSASNGSLITKGSNTQVTLTAGNTYKLEAIIRRFTSTSTWGAFRWYDVTNSTYVGIESFGEVVNSTISVGSTLIATHYVTPSVNTTYELRQTTVNTISVSANYATIEITQINPTIAVQATATGTMNATVGKVTLSNSYTQVVGASSPGTTIFTLPTLQPGTYLITAQAKVNGGYSAMGIFTGGSQVANTSVFNWYQASGTVNNGLQGTWVLTVTTPTVYTINAWGGGTVSAGSDGTAVANYIQINPTFALTAISGLTTTSDVNVGGNLNVTGTGGNVLTTGSISTTQNITGSVIISGSMNIITTKLQVGTGSGDEGGEILLAKSQTNNSLTGSGITIDSYQNRLRIFEQGGNARGGYFDLTTLGNGVSTNLAPTLYLLEAYADVTYTLPGSFTEDPCRYSVVNNTVNVSSSWFNTSTYTFTPQKAGYWEITATYDVYRNSETAMAIKKNNGIVVTAGSFGAVAQQVTKIVYLNGSTDFINVVNVGGAANSRSQYEGRSWFQARWVGE